MADQSDNESEVSYVDEPLIESDSDDDEVENNSSVVTVKKRKLIELKLKTREKKQKLQEDNSSNREELSDELYVTASGQLQLLFKNQPANINLQSALKEEDMLNVSNADTSTSNSNSQVRKSFTLSDAIACSGLKRILKSGTLDVGSPSVLVICSSAQRCTEVIGMISNKYRCRVAKLFAKHMKVP